MRRGHLLALARRALVGLTRNPTQIIPSISFPLIFLGLTSASLQRSTELPGFPPVDSFAQFAVTASVVQGVLFGAVHAGSAMASDIETGFFDRLITAPISRHAIVGGRLAGAAVLGAAQALFFLGVVAIFGTRPEGGWAAVGLIVLAAGLLAAGVGALVTSLGLKTGSSEAVQGMFPLVFASLFLSSAFFPRNLMTGWFHTAASLNPLSHVIEGLRAQVITGVDLPRWLVAMGIATAVLIVGLGLARIALEGRIRMIRGA